MSRLNINKCHSCQTAGNSNFTLFNFSNAYSAQDFIQELRKIDTRIIKLRLQLKDSEQELYQLYKCLEKIDHLSVALDSLLLINC
jgi:hypothetical protein